MGSGLDGVVVADRYEILQVIAQGGQALICSARDRRSGQLVALKLLTSANAQNREFVERLAREQEVMVALAGTNAVAVLDLCRAPGGAPCLVMELLEGEDLEQRLERLTQGGKRLSLDRVFEIFDPIVDTLERAHDAGILHRDLKPANVFLLSEKGGGGVRLLDFGLSSMKTAAPLTAVGTILGSPSYIAPETWSGQPHLLDRRADVYSLAVILFRVLGGRLPFEGETLHDKFTKTTSAERPSLVALRPDLREEVDGWVQHALAVDPAHRFSSVRALWKALWIALAYTPRARPRIPVADSIVNAWRAAADTFRRIIVDSSNAVRAPKKAPRPVTGPPKPIEVGAEWLLDTDVLDFAAPPERLDLEQILREAPAPPRQTPEAPSKQPPRHVAQDDSPAPAPSAPLADQTPLAESDPENASPPSRASKRKRKGGRRRSRKA
jgi:serine/threonine-protein kinase